jgi:hypothetical protein
MKTKERSMVSSLKFPLLLLSIGLGVTPQIYPQQGICEVQFSVLNTDRYVYGPVAAECAQGIWPVQHSRPFGNWGVKTETTDKEDGRQFEGWCHNRYLCDNNDDCKRHCTDEWYEWNSCTFHEWSPQSGSDFYNYNNETQQRSTRGPNHHGGGGFRLSASCPYDSDGDGYNESGGCKEALAGGFGVSGHRMELYELDPWAPDAHVETLRFPTLRISAATVDCDDVDYCGATGTGELQSPTSSSSSRLAVPAASAKTVSVEVPWEKARTIIAEGDFRPKIRVELHSSERLKGKLTSAKAVIAITRAVFSDPYSQCCEPMLNPGGCSVPGGGGWGF